MARVAYRQRFSGDIWQVTLGPRGHVIRCCDCGLVHRVHFKIRGKGKQRRLFMSAALEPRRTAAFRRSKKHRAQIAALQRKLVAK